MIGFRSAALNDETRRTGVNSGDLPVSSRRDGLQRLRKSLGFDGIAMALLTGEPGTGKTWLWRRLVSELPASWRWTSVDMSTALDAQDFLRLIAHGLGIDAADRLGAVRLNLARALEDDASDGRSWLVVIENAQNTPAQVWNEIQALVHAMETTERSGAVILTGPTNLAHLLSNRSLSALATRIRTHVHLLSLDLDESLELAKTRGNLGDLDRATLEEFHRDTRGNPRLLLQLLRCRSEATDVSPIACEPATLRGLPDPSPQLVVARVGAVAEPVPTDASTANRETASRPRVSAVAAEASGPTGAALVPSRPPLRIEEGLIEVGWGGNLEAEAGESESDSGASLAPAPPAGNQRESPSTEMIEKHEAELPSEEMIEDHYAALQAWTEWAKNRGRATSPGVTSDGEPVDRVRDSKASAVRAKDEQVTVGEFSTQDLRAEHEHEHAPYSQLFSRLRQSR